MNPYKEAKVVVVGDVGTSFPPLFLSIPSSSLSRGRQDRPDSPIHQGPVPQSNHSHHWSPLLYKDNYLRGHEEGRQPEDLGYRRYVLHPWKGPRALLTWKEEGIIVSFSRTGTIQADRLSLLPELRRRYVYPLAQFRVRSHLGLRCHQSWFLP